MSLTKKYAGKEKSHILYEFEKYPQNGHSVCEIFFS